MPSREQMIDQLSSQSTNERQAFTRAYADVIPGKRIEFRNRRVVNTVDSHGDFGEGGSRRRVSFLALDGSIATAPYLTLSGDVAGAGQLEKAADTALGAVANRLKPVVGAGSETAEQSEAFKVRRLIVRGALIDAALLAHELEHVGGSDAYVEDLAHFLYDAGNRLRLNDNELSAMAQNLSFVTTDNIYAALRETDSADSQETES